MTPRVFFSYSLVSCVSITIRSIPDLYRQQNYQTEKNLHFTDTRENGTREIEQTP